MKYAQWIMLATLGLTVACGDDPEPSNNTSTNNTSTNNTSTNNTSTNNTSTNNTSTNNNNAIVADVVEVEPNEELEQATAFNVGQSIGGNIAAGAGDNADYDVFVATLTAGTVLEVEFKSVAANLQAGLAVFDADDNVVRYLEASAGSSRQVFIPFTGEFYISVFDVRAEQQHGGDSATYVIETRIVEPNIVDATIPGSVAADGNDGKVDIYKVPASEDVLIFETFGTREPGEGQIDTVLIAYSPTAGLLDFNDDIDYDNDIYDSKVVFRPESETWVVVDYWDVSAANGYQMVSTITDDDLSAPQTLTVGTPMQGVIEDRGTADFDTDYFEVQLAEGEVARIELESTGDLQPTLSIYIYSDEFGFLSIADALPVGNLAAVEFGNPIDEVGTYYVVVDDERNIPFEGEGMNVGGDTFTYTLTMSSITWTPAPVTLPALESSTVGQGSYSWYSTAIAPGAFLVASTLNVSMGFTPAIATYAGGIDEVIEGNILYNDGEMPREVIVGVREAYFRTGDVDLRLEEVSRDGYMFVPGNEVEPNNTTAEATSIGVPGLILASTSGTNASSVDPDWYSVTLTAGQRILAFTGGTEAGADADTVMELYDATGMVLLVENDDFEGQLTTYFSAVSYEALADGDVFLKIQPYCTADSCDNGGYSLTVLPVAP